MKIKGYWLYRVWFGEEGRWRTGNAYREEQKVADEYIRQRPLHGWRTVIEIRREFVRGA